MLIRIQNGEIINLYNVAFISVDKEGTMGIKYTLTNNKIFKEEYKTEAEVDARVEELMSYNIGLTVSEMNEALETALEIEGENQ